MKQYLCLKKLLSFKITAGINRRGKLTDQLKRSQIENIIENWDENRLSFFMKNTKGKV